MQVYYNAGCGPEWGSGPRRSSGGPPYRGPELPEPDPKKHLFLRIDLSLTGLAAIPICWRIYEAWKNIPYARLEPFFVIILFLGPGLAALAAEAVLLFKAIRREKKPYAAAAYIIQIVCGIPSLWVVRVGSEYLNILGVHVVLMVLGVIGLMELLFSLRR